MGKGAEELQRLRAPGGLEREGGAVIVTESQLHLLINLLAAVTLFEMMVSIGMGVTLADLIRVARNGRLIGQAALANYVCVPAAAVGLVLLFRPHSAEPEQFPLIAAGFLIAAVCPGAPYGPPFTGIAKGNVARAVGLMTILAGSSALVAPLLLHFLLPLTSGDEEVRINVVKMISTLLIAQLLPLFVGLGIRRWRPALADRLKKPANLLSLVLNLATFGVILGVQWEMLVGIPVRGYLGMLALVLVGMAVGWLLGGPGSENRIAMTMATAVRNVGVSLVIATGSFPGTKAVTAATAFAIFQTIVMALVALSWGRLLAAPTGTTRTEGPVTEGVLHGEHS
jgi:BASS family bile acid:Na+ symporter